MTMPAMRAKYIAHEALFARDRIEERDGVGVGILDIDIEEFIEKFALTHIEAAVLQERNACAKRLAEILTIEGPVRDEFAKRLSTPEGWVSLDWTAFDDVINPAWATAKGGA